MYPGILRLAKDVLHQLCDVRSFCILSELRMTSRFCAFCPMTYVRDMMQGFAHTKQAFWQLSHIPGHPLFFSLFIFVVQDGCRFLAIILTQFPVLV